MNDNDWKKLFKLDNLWRDLVEVTLEVKKYKNGSPCLRLNTDVGGVVAISMNIGSITPNDCIAVRNIDHKHLDRFLYKNDIIKESVIFKVEARGSYIPVHQLSDRILEALWKA